MSAVLMVVLLVVFTWWFSTGVVLILQQRLQPGHYGTKVALVVCGAASVHALLQSGESLSMAAQPGGFISAVVLWGCIELSYYLGFIAGVHRESCPSNVTVWERFRLALGASIWHEVLVLVLGVGLWLSQHDAVNPIGLYTYLVLWLMRWSAKLNLFLGVPNFSTAWFPERLSYLGSYIRLNTISPFYFVSVFAASVVVVKLVSTANHSDVQHPNTYFIPAALLVLAVAEHLFMLIPFQDSKMWNRVFNSKS